MTEKTDDEHTVAQFGDQNFLVIRCWLSDHPNCIFLSADDVLGLALAIEQGRQAAKDLNLDKQLQAIGVMLRVEEPSDDARMASMDEMTKEGRGPLQ